MRSTMQPSPQHTGKQAQTNANLYYLFLLILFFGCSDNKQEYSKVQVMKKEVQKSLTLRGSVVPRGKELAQSLSKGEILFLAEHGTIIQKGELIFEINTEKLEDDIRNLEQDLSTQKYLLQVQERKLQLIKNEEEQTTLLKKEELAYAQLALREKMQKATDDERAILSLRISKQELNNQRSKEDLKRQEQLLKKDFVTLTHLDSYKARHKTAQEKLKELKIQQKIQLDPITQEQRFELQSDIERRQSELKRSQEALKRRHDESLYESKVINDKIVEITHKLNYKKKLIKSSTYHAQKDGIFLRRQYRDWRGGGRFKHYSIGQEINARDVIGEIIQSHSPFIELLLSEAEVNSLQENMSAEIQLAALPGIIAQGEIQHIGLVGQDRNDVLQEGSKQAKISTYRAEISLKKDETIKLRNGMSAIVHFSSPKTSQLIIPRAALIIDDNGIFVRQSKQKTLAIKGEVIDDFSFAVTSGLQEGQMILIPQED